MIYFDNAATTYHKPDNVIRAVDNSMRKYNANPGRSGHRLSQASAMAVYKVREKVADFFGASGPEKVSFTANCTEGLNFIIKGILKQGDHIVVSSLEHNAVMRPLMAVGADVSVAEVDFTDDKKTVEAFERCITPNTKLILCTGASNVVGKILPIREIGELAAKKGIPFAVDGAQLAGIQSIHMARDKIDFLSIAPHKGLYAPMGVGILITEKELPYTVIEGGTGTESMRFEQPVEPPERFESGTVNVPGIVGIGAGIDFIKQTGMERIYHHEIGLVQILYENLSRNGRIFLYTPYPETDQFAPVLSFNVEQRNSQEVAGWLDQNGIAVRAGLHCAPAAHHRIGTLQQGTVRVCPSFFNNRYEIDVLSRVLHKNFEKTVN